MTATRHTNYTFDGYDPSDGLTDGRWVQDGYVMRWVADEQPAVEPVVKVERPVHELRACPTCHAPLDSLCRTSTGRHREPHPTRLVPKRCGCGEVLERNKKLCDDCRAATRRERGRLSMQRTRERRRAARRKDDAA